MADDRYQVKIRDKCGACDGSGTIEIQRENQKIAGWKTVESHKCNDCQGTGYCDERWVDLSTLRGLMNS